MQKLMSREESTDVEDVGGASKIVVFIIKESLPWDKGKEQVVNNFNR